MATSDDKYRRMWGAGPPFGPVLDLWLGFDWLNPQSFSEGSKRWFDDDADWDRRIETGFGELCAQARDGGLDSWASVPHGRLALVVLLDQFTRNIHRGTAAAFAGDTKALSLALESAETGADRALASIERVFLYMPMQHSEQISIQQLSVTTFSSLAGEPAPPHITEALRRFAIYAKLHHDIVARFGRFPHRNIALGREHTAEESQYLADGGSTFGQ